MQREDFKTRFQQGTPVSLPELQYPLLQGWDSVKVQADVELGGQAIPAGSTLTLGIGAANRDPAAFADPDRLDLARQPNRHLAFAAGPHQCVGMTLARLEGRIAIGEFVARFPRVRLRGEPCRGRRARFRGLTELPVALTN